MGEALTIYQKEIVPRLDLKRLLAALSPKQTGANVYVLCPACGRHEGFIKQGYDTIGCNRKNGCGEHTNLLAYLNGGKMPTGKEWIDMIRELGKDVGVEIPERNWTPEQLAAIEQRRQEQDLLTRVFGVCHDVLPDDFNAVLWLTMRGLKAERLSALDLGAWDRDQVLKCATEEELKPFGLHDPKWNNRVIWPLRDHHGAIRALVGRDITEKADHKYEKTIGFDPKSLVLEGLDVARKYKHIVAGEGSLAVFTFREAGQLQMTAAGGSIITAKQWQSLFDMGIESVTLAFDNDKAGIEGTVKSLEEALQANEHPDIYAVDPAVWGAHNDPDRYLQVNGAQATGAILTGAASMNRYLARAYASKYDIATDKGRTQFLDHAARYLSQIKEDRRSLDAWENFFKRGVQELTDVDEDFFFDYVLSKRDEHKKDRLKDKLYEAQAAFREAVNNLDVAKARDELTQIAQELHLATSKEQLKALVRTTERLKAHDQHLALTAGKKHLGLAQKTLPSLDEGTLGLRLMTGILAGPGTGKTAFMMQVGTDILKHNPDTCFLFYSLEMSESEILTRMKSRASMISYDRLVLRNDETIRARANAMVKPITDRMFIVDEEVYPQVNVDLVLRDVARLKEETGCKHVVVGIDYLQRWPIPEQIKTGMNDEAKDEYRTNQMKRIRKAIMPDPLIVISEINKMDGFKAKGMQSAKGSVVFVFACDNVFTMNQIEEEELLDRIELVGDQFSLKQAASRYRKKKKEKISDEDAEQAFNLFTREMDNQGKSFVDFSIEKARGGRRKKFVLVHKHTCSDLKELTEHGEASARPES
ncbi:MAG TPA: DnaB-like helicase C-terminal domain-containing protein [Candidatus Obscuribacterales bacterium]